MADRPQTPVDPEAPPGAAPTENQDTNLSGPAGQPDPPPAAPAGPAEVPEARAPVPAPVAGIPTQYQGSYLSVSDGQPPALRARLAAALDDTLRLVRDHTPDLAVGGVTALVVTAGGWLVAAALTLAVWAMAAPAADSVAAPLHVAGQLWLAAHHVLLQTPDGPFGLSPLGFTMLPAGCLVLAGRYAAQRFDAGLWSFAALAVCYPLLALGVAWSAASGTLHADLGSAAGYPCLIACCGYGAGLLSVRTPSLERWAATAVRAGTAALAVLFGGAALIAALAVCLHFTEVVRLGDAIGQGAVGDAGLFLIDLALVPNLAIWALGFASGPGFAVGEGSSVSVGGSAHGMLPGLPLIQGVPHAGGLSPWVLLVFAIPLLAGTVAVLIIGRALGGPADRAAALGAAVPAVGAVTGAAGALSGGPVAAGAMSAVGPVPWQIALAVAGELALVAVVGFGLWYALDYARRPAPPDAADVHVEGLLPRYFDDHGAGDPVRPALVPAVPERGEEVEHAGDDAQQPQHPVEEQPEEAEPAADRPPVGEPGEPDAHDPLSVGLAGAPGPDGVVDGPDDPGQTDEPEGQVD